MGRTVQNRGIKDKKCIKNLAGGHGLTTAMKTMMVAMARAAESMAPGGSRPGGEGGMGDDNNDAAATTTDIQEIEDVTTTGNKIAVTPGAEVVM